MLKDTNGNPITRSYKGELVLDHKYTDDPVEKYNRAHEKRRLKAYIQGRRYFTHGFEVNNMMKWPARFPVEPKIETK